MRAILGLLLAGALLAGCASAERQTTPITWARVDGRPIDSASLAQARAICEAEAIAAGARYSSLSDTNLMAYDGMYPAVNFPVADFSGLGDLPRVRDEAAARRRQRELQDSMIQSAMFGCMARNGYIQR
jgi:hypothetical protein